MGLAVAPVAAMAFVLICSKAIRDWRQVFMWLLLTLPFTDLIGIALYPKSYAGDLFRDAFFVVPCYLGFVLDRNKRKRLPLSVAFFATAITLLAIVQCFNPTVPSILVGLVGLRAWALYLPCLLLGIELFSREEERRAFLIRFLKLGLWPLSIGLAEAVLLAAHYGGLFYPLYGSAAAAVSNGYASFAVGDAGTIQRVPATFTFGSGYYNYSLIYVTVALAVLRNDADRDNKRFVLFALAVAVPAVLTSGNRSAFLFLPALLALFGALSLGTRFVRPGVAVVIVAGFFGSLALFRVSVSTTGPYIFGVSSGESSDIIGGGFRLAKRLTYVGLGTGTDENGARNFYNGDLFAQIGGRWQESQLVKAWIELGPFGLALLVALLTCVFFALVRARRWNGTLAAAAAAYVAVQALLMFKASYLVQTPTDVFIWSFVGIALSTTRERIGERPERQQTSALALNMGGRPT